MNVTTPYVFASILAEVLPVYPPPETYVNDPMELVRRYPPPPPPPGGYPPWQPPPPPPP